MAPWRGQAGKSAIDSARRDSEARPALPGVAAALASALGFSFLLGRLGVATGPAFVLFAFGLMVSLAGLWLASSRWLRRQDRLGELRGTSARLRRLFMKHCKK